MSAAFDPTPPKQTIKKKMPMGHDHTHVSTTGND